VAPKALKFGVSKLKNLDPDLINRLREDIVHAEIKETISNKTTYFI